MLKGIYKDLWLIEFIVFTADDRTVWAVWIDKCWSKVHKNWK